MRAGGKKKKQLTHKADTITLLLLLLLAIHYSYVGIIVGSKILIQYQEPIVLVSMQIQRQPGRAHSLI